MPELILHANNRFFLSYKDGGLAIWMTDANVGASLYFVNDGNIYNQYIARTMTDAHTLSIRDESGNETLSSFQVSACYDSSEGPIYKYSTKDGEEHDITKEEYNDMIPIIANDDQVDWQEYNHPKSVLMDSFAQ